MKYQIKVYLCETIKNNMTMTPQQIRQVAPSVFTTEPLFSLSNKYSFVPTFELIEKFNLEGWEVSSARQVGKGSFAKHEVRMRNGGMPNVGDTLAEAIITNSHNGLSTLKFDTGLFRLVCSNGLTVPTSVAESVAIRHSNIDLGEVRKITDQFADRLPIIERSVSKMENTFLSDVQTIDLLQKSALLRWNQTSVPVSINFDELLVPEREADMGNSVWKTFNVIQEKFVRGGVSYRTPKGRAMSMKQLKDFQVINKINTGLWELAESYC